MRSKSSYLVLTDQLIFSGSNFLLTFLLARKLSISDFGLFSTVLLVTYLFVGIGNAMIVQPFQILAAKEQNKKSLGFVFQAFVIVTFIFALGLSLIRFLPISSIAFFQENLIEIIFFITAYVFQDFVRKILLAINHILLLLFVDSLFLFVFPFICFEENISLFKTLFIIGMVNFVSAIPGIIFFLMISEFSFKNAEFFRYYIKEGKWLLGASIIQWFSNNFFTLVAGIYLGINALGALRLVQSFFGLINIILQTVENYYLPVAANLYHHNKKQEKKIFQKNMLKSIWGVEIILLIFFLFSETIIVIIGGEKYQQYGFVIKLVSVLYVVILYSYPIRISIRITEQNKAFFIGYCISFVFSICSFHFLLEYGKLYGAVAGLVINQILMIVYWKFLLNKKQISVWE